MSLLALCSDAIDQHKHVGQQKTMTQTLTILGIESSCDDTAAAVVRGQDAHAEVLSSIVVGQEELHAAYGGVVPENRRPRACRTVGYRGRERRWKTRK